MADETKITWTGKSGKKYAYWLANIGDTFNAVPGNYIFVKETQPGSWKAIYIGETKDLDDRLSNPDSHEKMPCAKREGATHICNHSNDRGQKDRRDEESDLIASENPPCND